jgi:hypothetical protein
MPHVMIHKSCRPSADDPNGETARDDRVDDERPYLLDQVECEVGPSPAGLVQETDGRIEAGEFSAAGRIPASPVTRRTTTRP